ncbi:MAG TPA: hypothetical protein VGQ51_14290 [Puia sp.]|jgi:hypothetical protein|nr:hypothetical protein [Puia sp.]
MALRSSILKTVAYFDLFSYPLTREDIRYFLDTDAGEEEVDHELTRLTKEGRLYRLGTGTFYSLRNDPELAEKRLRGEVHADELLRIAARGARFLYQFPFVRGVCISGSLSKRCADKNADIDYFIITKANRLWIARTIMHLFKKLTYLRGRQHRYCMNYFIDEEALEIKEKNIFTAIELLTLMPACGNGGLTQFFQANNWTCQYLPHYRDRQREADGPYRSSLLKRGLERLFNNRLGSLLEDYLRRLTDSRWKTKTSRGYKNMKGDPMTLQCGLHFSRPDPGIFQQRILLLYQQKLNEVAVDPVSFSAK